MSYTHVTPKNITIEVDSWMSDRLPNLDFLNSVVDLGEEALTFGDKKMALIVEQFLDANCNLRDREIAFKQLLSHFGWFRFVD